MRSGSAAAERDGDPRAEGRLDDRPGRQRLAGRLRSDAAAVVVDHALPTTSSPGDLDADGDRGQRHRRFRSARAGPARTRGAGSPATRSSAASTAARSLGVDERRDAARRAWACPRAPGSSSGSGPWMSPATSARGARARRSPGCSSRTLDRDPLRGVLGDELVVVLLGRVGEGLVDGRRERHATRSPAAGSRSSRRCPRAAEPSASTSTASTRAGSTRRMPRRCSTASPGR